MTLLLLSLFVKVAIIAGLTVLGIIGLRRFAAGTVAAASRHALGVAACAALLALPVLSLLLPARHLLTLPVASAGATVPLAPVPYLGETPNRVSAIPVVTTTAPILNAAPSAPAVTAVPPAAPPKDRFAWRWLVVSIYLAGVLACLVRLIARHVAVWRLVRRAVPSSRGDGNRAVYESDEVRVPLVVGAGRWARILLPTRAVGDWPEERLRVALLHEQAHAERGDYLTQLLADVVCALYWFNPLVWLLAATIRDEAERAADDCTVLAGTVPLSDYATHLLAVACDLNGRASEISVAPAMAQRSVTDTRIRALLSPATARIPRLSPRLAAAIGGVVLSGTVLLSPLQITLAVGEDWQSTRGKTDSVMPRQVALAERSPRGQETTAPTSWIQRLPNGNHLQFVGIEQLPNTVLKTPAQFWLPDGTPFASREQLLAGNKYWSSKRRWDIVPSWIDMDKVRPAELLTQVGYFRVIEKNIPVEVGGIGINSPESRTSNIVIKVHLDRQQRHEYTVAFRHVVLHPENARRQPINPNWIARTADGTRIELVGIERGQWVNGRLDGARWRPDGKPVGGQLSFRDSPEELLSSGGSVRVKASANGSESSGHCLLFYRVQPPQDDVMIDSEIDTMDGVATTGLTATIRQGRWHTVGAVTAQPLNREQFHALPVFKDKRLWASISKATKGGSYLYSLPNAAPGEEQRVIANGADNKEQNIGTGLPVEPWGEQPGVHTTYAAVLTGPIVGPVRFRLEKRMTTTVRLRKIATHPRTQR